MTSYAAPCCPNVCDDDDGPCGLPSDFPTTFTFNSSFKVGMRNAYPPYSNDGTQFTYTVSMTSKYEFRDDLCGFRRTSLVGSHEYRCINSPSGSNYPGDFVETNEILDDSVGTMFWGRANSDQRREIDFHDSEGNPQYDFEFANSSNTSMTRIRESVPDGTPFIEVNDHVGSTSDWTPRESGALWAYFRGRGSGHGVKLFFMSSLALPGGFTVPDLRYEPFAERFIQYPTESDSSNGPMTPFAAGYGGINGGTPHEFPWLTYTGVPSNRYWLDRKPSHLSTGPFGEGGPSDGGTNICPKATGFKRPGFPPFNSGPDDWSDLDWVADGEYYEYGVRMGFIQNITEDSRVSFEFS